MAWLGKVTLGNFGDIAGAVTKLSESVKNIEKNFDSALGFDDKGGVHDAQNLGEKKTSMEPPAFVGQRDLQKESSSADVHEPRPALPEPEEKGSEHMVSIETNKLSEAGDDLKSIPPNGQQKYTVSPESIVESESTEEKSEQVRALVRETSPSEQQVEECAEVIMCDGERDLDAVRDDDNLSMEKEVPVYIFPKDDVNLKSSSISSQLEAVDSSVGSQKGQGIDSESQVSKLVAMDASVSALGNVGDGTNEPVIQRPNQEDMSHVSASMQPSVLDISHQNHLPLENNFGEVGTLNAEIKMLEVALQDAANQSKVKADEILRLSMENDDLKAIIDDLKKKSSDAEMDALREEYQQRLNVAERKVYTLTKERDMLRREQNRKDSSILLKEKDEIIKQVMAEGEELSKKQAAQESQMRKLRAQIRELEEEKQRLKSKLQVEEATVESIKKDKAATEKALQEAVERTQVELAIQKEFFSNALNEAKEAEARAEVRADTEAKLELERRLREAGDREMALVQTLEELRQALSRTVQQAASREDMLRKDVEDLERRCQAAELRYEELVASVPESTRPLLRQIEAFRESAAMRAEAWSGVERALNARLQEAEAKAAASQERERAMNERLTQTLSRMAVLEAQVSCLKAEQAQLTRSLEKERQRASENRQEYLAALESAATHEGRAKQLEEDMKELRNRSKRELAEEKTMRELLQQELEHEKKKQMEHEALLGTGNWAVTDKANASRAHVQLESGSSRSLRRFSSGSSGGNLEESYYLQASLDSTSEELVGDRRNISSPVPSSYNAKGIFPNAEQLETFLSQKDGELALYTSRLIALESTRDTLAEELVKATTECEKLRSEVASLPGMRSELESLRRRHTSALELMGERDEQVEELKADLADVKQMYREQIDMLVNQIEKLSVSIGSR